METRTKPIFMSANGTTSPKGIVFDWSSLIQGILSAGVLACVGFLIKMNSTIAVIEEQKNQENRIHDEFRQNINEIKLDVRDLRDRAIRAERLEQQKP